MPSKTVTMSENARANYQSYLNKRIYPAIGGFTLPEITPAQITALLLDIQAEGKAHSTVIRIYTILYSFFKMTYLGDMIDRNPMDKVERPKPRKDEVRDDSPLAYTPAEVRRGECCALQWKNIDFSTGAIVITGNLCYVTLCNMLRFEPAFSP